ncbi:MAG TPA: Ig-like domain-containing protein, partial [Chloroflexia bacterium]|nr:Ig-like domain-containing protein [Chloroflexia bacterium]
FDPPTAKGVRAITPQEAFLITDILADNQARTPIFGANSALKLSRPAAAKTGTTENYRDSWILGYTPDLAVGVWVGNNDGRPMSKVAGARGAGPIWHNFMEGVFANPQMEQILALPGESAPPTEFTRPPGLVQAQVSAVSGLKPSPADTALITEWFVSGTEPQKVDDLYQLFNICIEHAVPELANADCPPESVIQRPYLVLPPEFKAWESTLAKPLGPPTAVCCFPTPVPTESPTPSITDTPVPGIAPPLQITYPTPRPPPAQDDEFPGAFVNITAPRPGAGLGGAVTITGSAGADDFSYYQLDYSAGANPNSWVAIDGQVTSPVRNGVLGVWDTNPLPEGAYTLRLTLVGNAQQTRQYTVPVQVERSTPKIRLTAPENGSTLYAGQVVTLSAAASGPQGLAGVEFYVDNVRVGVAAQAPYQTTWLAQPGDHTVDAVAYSLTGRHTTSDPVSITVAEAPTPTATPAPPFAIIVPQDQTTVAGPTVAILVAAGPAAAVVRVDFYVDGWNISSVSGQGTFQANWQTIPGRHTILAIGYNATNGEVARKQIVVTSSPNP